MVNRFGTNLEPNLDALLSKAQGVLQRSEYLMSELAIGPLKELKQIPSKNYRAVGKADAYHYISNKAELLPNPLTVVIFAPYDGTGNRNDFNFPDLEAQYTPRAKDVLNLEVMIPIGTAFRDKWIDRAVNLTHFSVEGTPGELTESELGLGQDDYEEILRRALGGWDLATGITNFADYTQVSEFNFGNAHAVGFSRIKPDLLKISGGTWFQVAGFLNLPSPDDTLKRSVRMLQGSKCRSFLIR